jgi:flavin reductase (DIM6/NTAB) family NADH-FMN oxidoreductase RutF
VHGATVSAFFTLSLEPLQVLVSLSTAGRLAPLLRESGVFAVCVLAAEQEAVSRAFATPSRPIADGQFPDIGSGTAATGAPIIEGCLAFFDCRLATSIDQGDHTLFVGAVQAVGATDGEPLVYFDGTYRRLALE